MYRTRSVVAGLLPLLPGATTEHLAAWLTKGYLKKAIASQLPLTTAIKCRHYTSAPPPPPPGAAEPFLNGTSSIYVEEMYNSWLQDPKSVHASWDSFFRNASAGAEPGHAYQAPPSLATPGKYQVPVSSLVPQFGAQSYSPSSISADEKVVDDHLAVQAIIRSYQVFSNVLFLLSSSSILAILWISAYKITKGLIFLRLALPFFFFSVL